MSWASVIIVGIAVSVGTWFAAWVNQPTRGKYRKEV